MKVKTLLIAGLILALMAGLLGSAGLAAAPPEKIDVLIGFHEAPGRSEQALVRGVGGEIYREFTIVNAVATRMTARAVDALSRNPAVRYVELDGRLHALGQTVPWGIDRVFGDEGYPFPTWDTSTGDSIKVAVIDSGIDYNHQDLDANYVGGYDFVNEDNNPMDDNGHGTHVAGTIAAVDNLIGVVGVAPDAGLYALKVLGADGSGSYSDVIAALQWCVDNGIQVTNNSYGSSGDPGTTVKEAFDNSYDAGLLHVAAAGNSGNRRGVGNNVIYPAKYDSVIAVAASDDSDRRASFSSTGPAVELIAPGVNVLSTLPGNRYGWGSGTSMASPHVAGVAALAWAADSTLKNFDVRGILQQTAEDLGLPWNHQGYGLVRADLAVSAASGTEPPPAQYELTISSTAGGSVTTPGEGTYTYDEGTVVELVATPDTDYEFVSWTRDTDPIANVKGVSTTITMNGDYSIIANFKSAGTPAPEVFIVDPDSASRRARLMVAISGVNFQDGAAVDFGEGVVVRKVTFVSAEELRVRIRVHSRAAVGPRHVTVTNPDGQSGTLADGFTVS